MWVFAGSSGWLSRILEHRQSAGQDLEAKIFLVAQPVGSALDDADLVVEPFDETEGDLVLRLAIGGYSIPVTLDHIGELLVGLEPLPLERCAPILKEAPCPTLVLVAPQLTERFLEEVSGVQSLVGPQQELERLAPFQREVLLARQQGIFLALDVAALFPRQPRILLLAHMIERLAQMAHDVELVEQDRGLRRRRGGGVAKRLPHVHHGKADAPALRAKPLIKLGQAGFRAVPAAEPDRPHANQVADHDAIIVAFANRDLVDPDHTRRRSARLGELSAHVLLVQLLDGVPVQLELLGHIPDRRATTAPADLEGKSLGVARIVGQELHTLTLHLAAMAAIDAPHLELQEHPHATARNIPHPARSAIVPARLLPATCVADCFFDRRTSVMIRAYGSPKTPRTCSTGRKPANRYASANRRRFVELATIAPHRHSNGEP